jgi:membrane protein implicated in regulation of membrane protease activity
MHKNYIFLSLAFIILPVITGLGLAGIAFGIGGQAGWLLLGTALGIGFSAYSAMLILPLWAISAFFAPRLAKIKQAQSQLPAEANPEVIVMPLFR